MADPFPAGDFVRIIFTRGVQLLRSEDRWLVPSSERLEHVEEPAVYSAAHDLQRLICDTDFNVPFFQPRRLFDPVGQPVSRARYLKGYVEDAGRRVYKYMVEHHLYCAVAHLGYLAEAYAGITVLENRHRWSVPEHARAHSRGQLQDSALRHGEAVFASLVSALDASRFLLWRPDLRPATTLPQTLDELESGAPEEFTEAVRPLQRLWDGVGEPLVAHRDCTVRFPPSASGREIETMLNDADTWEAQCLLPDNPDARHVGALRYAEGLDLLEYAWDTTCAVVRCLESVLPAVFSLAQVHYPESRWRWLSA